MYPGRDASPTSPTPAQILKKHHKRTGLLLRAPHLTNMLGQPFCSVEVGNAYS